MGNGCGNALSKSEIDTNNTKINNFDYRKTLRKLSNINCRSGNLINQYSVFQFKNSTFSYGNMLIFTYQDGPNNQFIVLDSEYNESVKFNAYKENNVCIGYSKGNKIDYFIQDKFFVLIDGNIQVFCLVDGHGPYGNIVAQLIQDKIFQVKNESILKK